MHHPRLLAGVLLTLASCVAEEPTLGEGTQEIVGGTAAQITAVPWQVSLQTAAGAHFCGGSIVAPTWIVTAAHCVVDGAPGRVVAGISRLSQSATGQIRNVKRVITYPGYTDVTTGKDAALIELATPLTLDGTNVKAIRPITSASRPEATAAGAMTTVSGWGATVEGAQTLPDQLQSVQVPIVAQSVANAAYNMTITEDQIAAGLAAGGKDSCQGDSGGPLVVMDGAEYALAGIVSWGEGCARANLPGLYARVSSFAKWMDGYVGGMPTAAAGTDVTAAPGMRVSLDGSSSSDSGFGVIATYTWRQVSGAPVTLDTANAKQAAFMAPTTTGAIELELEVTDEAGNKATDRVVVTIASSGGGGSGGGGNGDELGDDVYGGCTAHGGNTGPALLLVAGVMLLRRRRR